MVGWKSRAVPITSIVVCKIRVYEDGERKRLKNYDVRSLRVFRASITKVPAMRFVDSRNTTRHVFGETFLCDVKVDQLRPWHMQSSKTEQAQTQPRFQRNAAELQLDSE